MTFLSVIDKVDKFPYGTVEGYYTFLSHDGTPIGYISPHIPAFLEGSTAVIVEKSSKTVSIAPHLTSFEARNEAFAKLAETFRHIPEFHEQVHLGWRNELYTIYNPSHTAYLLVERAFSILLGVVTYGVHVNGYTRDEDGLKLWIPRRSATKPTYPGMLDNTVAGGLGYPHGIWETVVKECYEEAGFDETFVRLHASATGVVLYMYMQGGPGLIVQPEVEYIYDLVFEKNEVVKPTPVDGEAEDFQLMPVDEVLKRLDNGEFKPNCGLVVVDFLIRHGYITPENEPKYMEIVARCHRKIEFPTR